MDTHIMKFIYIFFLIFTSLYLGFSGITSNAQSPSEMETLKESYRRDDKIPQPAENPLTKAKIRLGKKLFFDPRISKNANMSCATCHNPSLGWEDGMSTGLGHQGNRLGRHTPTILNLAWAPSLFWDGRAKGLEQQASGPIMADAEMGMSPQLLLDRLQAISGYKAYFESAFPGEGMTIDTVSKAIATYERTIVSPRAPFDKWIAGKETAISDEAKRGFVLFNGKARCAICHQGWRFTDDAFHDIGLKSSDPGRFNVVKDEPALKHAFKTPTLRSISQRAPYMHDGSLNTLEDVIRHYENGFIRRPSLSPAMEPYSLTDEERQDLVAFLSTLTSSKRIIIPSLP